MLHDQLGIIRPVLEDQDAQGLGHGAQVTTVAWPGRR
jgi:hypothetical protein